MQITALLLYQLSLFATYEAHFIEEAFGKLLVFLDFNSQNGDLVGVVERNGFTLSTKSTVIIFEALFSEPHANNLSQVKS